jgi:cytochrome oxidase Cu insertion factor (SCO1/SenC/PrrC family)
MDQPQLKSRVWPARAPRPLWKVEIEMLSRACIIFLTLGLLFSANPVAKSGSTQGKSVAPRKAGRYACPMHPEVTSTKPGKCPKCRMALRLTTATSDDKATAGNEKDTILGDPALFSSSRIPDVRVLDQNGSRINFYSDLVKGKTVAINFIFTTCTTICPPLTATFRRVQQDLMERAPDVRLISISVDPSTDTPERLRDFAAKFKAGAGWTFVTGEKSEIDSLLKAFGVAVADKNDHTPMIFVGNDAKDYWTRTYGLSSPAALEQVIAQAAAPR